MGKGRRRKAEAKKQTPVREEPRTVFEVRAFALYALAIAVATVVAYTRVRHNGFVYYDDPKYVTENHVVLGGLTLDGIKWAFTTGTDANWFPITWLSHMLDVELFGLNPAAHHLTSVVIHIASAVLLLLALTWMTKAPGRSAFVAALFALHPAHVESVAWVAERKDVLSTFFLMLTLCAYALYLGKPTRTRYAAILAAFAIGLMCKPMLVTLPFVLLLLDFWPLGRTARTSIADLVKEKIPLFALVVVSSVVTFMVQRSGGAVGGLDSFPFATRVANAMTSYVEYIRVTLWPAGLAAFYPYPESISPVLPGLAVVLLGGITVAAVRSSRTRPYVIVGWLWYLGTLVPVIGLVQVGNQALADRYTYVPLVGIFIVLSWGVRDIAEKMSLPKFALAGAAVAVVAVLGAISQRQVGYWRDSTSLWTRALAVTSDNHVAHNNLGRELAESGKLDEAIVQYEAALRIKPAYTTAHTNLGAALAKRGRPDEAIASYKEALRIKSDLPEAHLNLGSALAAQGKVSQAMEHYRTALTLNPNLADAHANLGLVLARSGQVDEAMKEYAIALRLNPSFVEVHNNFGYALASQGRLDEAILHFNEAVRLKPDFILARINLAMTLANAGKRSDAVREFGEVLRLDPSHQMARQAVERLQAR